MEVLTTGLMRGGCYSKGPLRTNKEVCHVGSTHVRSQQVGRYCVPHEDQLRSCTALASVDHGDL